MKTKGLNTITLILSAFLTLGIKFLFPVCGPMEDGSYMRCHYSGEVIFGIGVVLVILSLISYFMKEENALLAFRISFIPLGILLLLVPTVLIGVCGSEMMRCKSVTLPAVIILGIAIAVVNAVQIVVLHISLQKEQKGAFANVTSSI